MAAIGMSGGEKLQAYLQQIASNLAAAGTQPHVRVGFLEGSIYPDGTPVAQIAAQNEWGATIQREPSTVTIYRLPKAGGGYLRKGRFVKRSLKKAVASTHAVGAYSITIPPRPFFRNMIKAKAPGWGDEIAKLLKSTAFGVRHMLEHMGERIKGQLQQSINDTNSPPLAASTIAKKSRGGVSKIAGVMGPEKPLIDTGFMWNQVDYEVSE